MRGEDRRGEDRRGSSGSGCGLFESWDGELISCLLYWISTLNPQTIESHKPITHTQWAQQHFLCISFVLSWGNMIFWHVHGWWWSSSILCPKCGCCIRKKIFHDELWSDMN